MKARSITRTWTAVALVCGTAAGALASGAQIDRPAGAGGQPPPLIPWILVGRPPNRPGHAGVLLFADVAGEVDRVDNLLTGAHGEIRSRHIPDPRTGASAATALIFMAAFDSKAILIPNAAAGAAWCPT